jgi:hypothetical protein
MRSRRPLAITVACLVSLTALFAAPAGASERAGGWYDWPGLDKCHGTFTRT